MFAYQYKIVKRIALISQSSVTKTSIITFSCYDGLITAGDFLILTNNSWWNIMYNQLLLFKSRFKQQSLFPWQPVSVQISNHKTHLHGKLKKWLPCMYCSRSIACICRVEWARWQELTGRKEARYRISTTPGVYAGSSWNYVRLNLTYTFLYLQTVSDIW